MQTQTRRTLDGKRWRLADHQDEYGDVHVHLPPDSGGRTADAHSEEMPSWFREHAKQTDARFKAICDWMAKRDARDQAEEIGLGKSGGVDPDPAEEEEERAARARKAEEEDADHEEGTGKPPWGPQTTDRRGRDAADAAHRQRLADMNRWSGRSYGRGTKDFDRNYGWKTTRAVGRSPSGDVELDRAVHRDRAHKSALSDLNWLARRMYG